MIGLFSLTVHYAARAFARGRVRSAFAVFCVFVSVASLVALRQVSQDFAVTLTAAPRAANLGDLAITPSWGYFTAADLGYLDQLRATGVISDVTAVINEGVQVRRVGGGDGTPYLASVRGLDPARYPLVGRVTAVTPAGAPVGRLLRAPDDLVVSQDLAARLGLGPGDRVSLLGAGGSLTGTVRGVAKPLGSQSNTILLQDIDFVYAPITTTYTLLRDPARRADTVYVTVGRPGQVSAVARRLGQHFGPLFAITTAADVSAYQKGQMRAFSLFLGVLALVAVLIGGIGVVNTTLVGVRRRLREIAIVKALGGRRRQVVVLLLAESLLTGGLGSGLGVAAGLLLAVAADRFITGLVSQPVVYAWRPGVPALGLFIGLVAAVVFSFWPVWRATAARPVAALREEAVPVDRSGRAATLLIGAALVGVMGAVGELLIGSALAGLALAYGIALGILLLMGLFWLVVAGVGRLPALGQVTFHLAVRNLDQNRRRSAATLVAVTVGMLSVAVTLVLAQSLNSYVYQALAGSQHFNLVTVAAAPDVAARVDAALAAQDGGVQVEHGAAATGQLLTIDGRPAAPLLDAHARQLGPLVADLNALNGRDLLWPQAADHTITAGRDLGPQDDGTNHVLLPAAAARALGLGVGATLVLSLPAECRMQNAECRMQNGNAPDFCILHSAFCIPVTVVGLSQPNANAYTYGTGLLVSAKFLRGVASQAATYVQLDYVDVTDGSPSDLARTLSQAVPQAFVLDVTQLVPIVNQTLDQLTLVPLSLGLLALFAGTLVIANTVALSVLERRREMGLMKALGARRGRVLAILVTEAALVGLLGGAAGVGLAAGAAYLTLTYAFHLPASISPALLAEICALSTLVAGVTAAAVAWRATSERPLLVLRYE